MARHAISGQALLDGVMMVIKDTYAVSVQTKKGIVTRTDKIALLKHKITRIPFIRGIIMLGLMLYLGIKVLFWTSTVSDDEEPISTPTMILTVAFSLILAFALFKLLPLVLADSLIPRTDAFLFNLVDGLFRLAIFVGYIWLISLLPDVDKLFQYHGAEHKTINAYDATGKLTVKEVMKATRMHPRCSTTFVVFVLIIAILIFSLVPLSYPFWQLLGIRLLLVLPIAAVAFEVIRYTSRYPDNPLYKVILVPGYWVQKLTTREPTEEQVRVAIAATKAAIADQ